MSKEKWMYVVLGIFLILTGLVSFIPALSGIGIVIAILAIAAGALIFIVSPGISYSIGWILAAIYLILYGLMSIFSFSFAGSGIVMAVLALAAGILLLVKAPKLQDHIGFALFTIWLILVGLTGLVSLGGLGVVIAIVAVASGVLMLLDK